LGVELPAYTKRPKRRVIQAPKFYFSNVGVVNFLAKRGNLEPGSELFGKAFENWVFHEIRSYSHYTQLFSDFSYWRLTSGAEVDFIVNDMEVAIEAKATGKVNVDHLKWLRELIQEHPRLKKRIVVSLDGKRRKTEDGIEILPYREFTQRLWAGDLF